MTSAGKVLLIITVWFFSAIGPQSLAGPESSPKAVIEIRKVLDRQVEAWNKGDLDGFMQGYWRSSELSFFSGASKLSGWDATLDRYRKRYQSEGREMGQLQFLEIDARPMGPSDAFVRGRWELRSRSGTTGGLFTLIFRRFDDGWKIIHDHTSSS
ncbi:MAG TPA: nuclear transport factor 2 family protein [Acidobacteriota bacterium]|jgi:beta-aspartyl-peptidase (threonine type)